jgi:amino acid transporter
MLFSYAVRAIYIESCAMFTRGGVYRVVKEAMGGTLAKLSVSALMFDYMLTGPISGVSAGQYIVGTDFANKYLPWSSMDTVGGHRQLHRRGHRGINHDLFLVAQHARHTRIVRRRAAHHVCNDGHGRAVIGWSLFTILVRPSMQRLPPRTCGPITSSSTRTRWDGCRRCCLTAFQQTTGSEATAANSAEQTARRAAL